MPSPYSPAHSTTIEANGRDDEHISCFVFHFGYRQWPADGARQAKFYTVSGAINNLDTLRIEDEMDARTIACNLQPRERKLLAIALKELHDAKKQGTRKGVLSRKQTKQLFIVNATPFIGFGLLDNMIMIFAGEYIDQSLGVYLSISTMAAAALGNIISDVAGVGLAHYVESLVSQAGIKHPVLTSEQLESSSARNTVNMARAFGLIIGCFIGMFPLLFFDDPHRSVNQTAAD